MSKTTVSANQADSTMASHADAIGHGNSPAAWTCVIVMLVGALISSIAFVIASTPIFVGGLVVMVIGLIVGLVMRKAGYGVGGSKLQNNGH
ncbi:MULTISPECIES: HGxxPAAW family protein [Paenarthrobacter]|jgi:phage tail tape-measure protein|uniref:HGxxPAAW family protein n=1 Tax=Paenarthrobacter TaxID=1742992 RepID=UPI00119CAF6A|nr:HGxxPAAW family protein [Paenarthrobacter nicotinovorans]